MSEGALWIFTCSLCVLCHSFYIVNPYSIVTQKAQAAGQGAANEPPAAQPAPPDPPAQNEAEPEPPDAPPDQGDDPDLEEEEGAAAEDADPNNGAQGGNLRMIMNICTNSFFLIGAASADVRGAVRMCRVCLNQCINIPFKTQINVNKLIDLIFIHHPVCLRFHIGWSALLYAGAHFSVNEIAYHHKTQRGLNNGLLGRLYFSELEAIK